MENRSNDLNCFKVLFKFIFLLSGILLNSVLTSAQLVRTGLFKEPMVNARTTFSGGLEVTPSATSSADDFNFLIGNWTMHNKRLRSRLVGSKEWIEYESSDENGGPILNGLGDLDLFRTSYNTQGNKKYEGLTLRIFNPETRLWSLYWVDSNLGIMDPPVVGSFEKSIGRFYCKDTFRGKPILIMFKWDKTDLENPEWSQSFSPDDGVTWEMNQANISHRTFPSNK